MCSNCWCDGTVVVTCTVGATARFDCAALHPALTCRIEAYGQADCQPAAEECDRSVPETCADGVITFCSMGAVATLDCMRYGFTGCATETVDVDPGTSAYCTGGPCVDGAHAHVASRARPG